MGYYTKFKLTIVPVNEDLEYLANIKDMFRDIVGRYDFDDITDTVLLVSPDWNGGDGIKWYEYTENMLRVSDKFHGTLFILDGVGEEWGNIWRKYFKDDMCYYAERAKNPIDYDPYGGSRGDELYLKIEDDFEPHFEIFDYVKLKEVK